MLFGLGGKPEKRDSRLLELVDELEDVKRQVRSLQLEWESTYNKIRAILARFNKRDEREEAAHPSVPEKRLARTSNLGNGDAPYPRITGPGERNNY